MLGIKNLTVSYGTHTVVDDLSFSVSEGQWLMIAGPNGAGKSTVLGAITQGVNYTGEVLYKGRELKKIKAADRAKEIGVLAQNHFVGYEFSVEEVVRLGRYSHSRSLLKGRNDYDNEAVEKALALTGMDKKRDQSVLTLSGGELQRTFLAQVFAQEPKLLLLDEPTNHLDLIYQKQVFAIISDWLKQPGRAVVSVVHDLSLAKAYGTHAVLMSGGKTVSQGEARDVLTSKNLDPVYGMDVSAWMNTMLSQWNDKNEEK